MDAVLAGLGLIGTPQAILVIVLGAVLGLVLGALPGLTATMGVTLMLPISVYLPPAAGMGLLLAVYSGAVAGASVPAILLGIPGNPNAIATVRDGHAMARRGQAGLALGAAALASLIGGVVSLLLLALFAPALAPLTMAFGPAERTTLAILGLAAVASIAADDLLKGLTAAALGVALALIGLDPFTNAARMPFPELTRGTPLQTGLPLVPALIGLFGIAQVLIDLDAVRRGAPPLSAVRPGRLLPAWRKLRAMWRLTAESSAIGTFIGAVPGAGASVAVFLAYERAKALCARPGRGLEPIGDGKVEGVFAPEVANNAVTGGALIPVLTLGLPGDATTAVVLGALLIHGVVPGHALFAQDLPLAYAIFFALGIAIVAVFAFQMIGIRVFPRILAVPMGLLLPVVLLFCLVGAFAVAGQSIVAGTYNVAVALGFGVAGYLLRKGGYAVAPVVLGLILGPLLEENARRAIRLAAGDVLVFAREPIAATFLFIAVAWVAVSLVTRRRGR